MNDLLKKIGIDMSQSSTKKGLALVGSGVALVMGHPELLTASISDAGVHYGGMIGTAVPVVLGIWETLRNEFK